MTSSTATSATPRWRRPPGTRAGRVGFVLVLLVARTSSAQNLTREVTAQVLFEEATSLFERGAWDQACAKFLASDELDPRGGTLLNLALCREKQGRTASAWMAYSEARNRSLKEARPERVAFAEKKVAELKLLLPRLRVVVAETNSVEVRVDGQRLPAAAWNTGVPVDPGDHRIEATAPARKAFSMGVRAVNGEETTASVPVLAPDRVVVIERLPAAHRSSWVGFATVGAGVAAVGVGAVFGVQALAKRSDAESLCASGFCEEGRAANEEGVRASWVSNVGIGIGLVAIAAGVYLLLRQPAGTTRSAVQSTPAP